MLNIDELIIIYIILNNQINKQVIEYVIFDSFIIRVVFGSANTVEYLLLTRPVNTNCYFY